MSALAPAPQLADGSRRPPLGRLMGAVFGGEVLAVLVLWIPTMLLGGLRLAPLGGGSSWVWLPWQIDGIWALAGAVAWGYLICLIVAIPVTQAIERRGYGRPAAGWMRISIAVSGYGAMAVGETSFARVVVAVLAGAAMTRLVAFDRDGSVRAWRWRTPLRFQIAAGVALALIALSYSVTHSFVYEGTGLSSGNLTLKVGHSDSFYVATANGRVPVDITGVSFTGTGLDHVVVSSNFSSQPAGESATRPAGEPGPPPYHLGAGKPLWLTATLRMASCGTATISGVRLSYTALGIKTAQTIALPAQTLDCSGS
jgi:hypothetical protein